jgi:hypothetical protein
MATAQKPAQELEKPEPSISASHAEIASLAYSYWEQRGRPDGEDLEDWLRAEEELERRCLDYFSQ